MNGLNTNAPVVDRTSYINREGQLVRKTVTSPNGNSSATTYIDLHDLLEFKGDIITKAAKDDKKAASRLIYRKKVRAET